MVGNQWIKDAVGSVAMSSSLRPLMRSLLKSRCNIVYYHFVGESQPFYKAFSGDCSIDQFNNDLRFLRSYFDFVPLQRILDVSRSNAVPSDPLLAITFDDGFDLIRSGVMDVLDDHRVTATMFLITSCVDNKNLMWRNKLSAIWHTLGAERLVQVFNEAAPKWSLAPVTGAREIMATSLRWPMAHKDERTDYLWKAAGMPPIESYLDEYRPYLTWEDVDVWQRHGHDLGLHTHTHPVCAGLDAAQIEEEIVQPAARLKERFGLKAVPFSYPFGIRLPREAEEQLFKNDTIQCALGVGGSSLIGTSLDRLERASGESALGFSVFGKSLIYSAMPFLQQ